MKVKAYGFNMRNEDYEIIKNMGHILTSQGVEIFDLNKHDIESNEQDVLLLFGVRAQKKSEGKKFLAKIDFPEVEKLDKHIGDSEERQSAKATLIKFRDRLEKSLREEQNTESQVITEAHLPEAAQIQTLEQQIQKKEIVSWNGMTRDGRRIKLTQEPEIGTADVNLTFDEFTALNRFMEVFGVKETQIVFKPSASSRKNDNP